MFAEQEDVGAGGAIDSERIGAIVGVSRVYDIDERVRETIADHRDNHVVGLTAAIDVDRVADDRATCGRNVTRPIVASQECGLSIDDDDVLTIESTDLCVPYELN